MIKIVITGPESTGKTTLARELAEHFAMPLVREFARYYIDQLSRNYEEHDLLKIAAGQIALENDVSKTPVDFLIHDTDLITVKIWSEYKYGQCDPKILKWIEERPYDHYFLCGADIPWQFDPQRENPKDRTELYKRYKKELDTYQKSYTELKGNQETRLKKAILIIQNLYFI